MAADFSSVSPSPSRDQDVFGKELRLSDAERKLLSGAGDIFLHKTLQVDSHSKKGDPTEPRTLVISNSRCYTLHASPVPKLESSFNFLRIQQIQCLEKKLSFQLSGEARPREFHADRRDSVEVVSLITAQLKNVFPNTPLDLLMKITFDPDSLRSQVSSLRDELTGMMERVEPATVQGFITSYAFLCNYFEVEYNKEVSWYLKNVYLAHGLREIKLSDFDFLTSKEFLPLVSTLRHNTFFEGIVERDSKLSVEVTEELCHVLHTSPSFKTLVLSNCALRLENVIRLSTSLKNNPRASLTNLDLSDTTLDEKAVEALGAALEQLAHGLSSLKLVNCKITAKGGSILANAMKQNRHMQYSLVHFDLSCNPLGPDHLAALAFIKDPQNISVLKLANCSLLLESVVPLLNRGCTQALCELDLSHNVGKGKKVVYSGAVASGLQQFCSSSIAVNSISLAGCKLTSTVVMSMMEGLAVNPNVTSVAVNISSNDLGGSGAQQMLAVVGRVNCLKELNLSECNLDQNMADIVNAVSSNKALHHLKIGKNFNGKNVVRMAAVQQLASLLAKEDCHLLSLCLDDSHLKELTTSLLQAVVDNSSLEKINLSGNQMGSQGARGLAKALLCNCSLSEVSWDRNDTPLRGFQEVTAAMEHNYTLRKMPLPLYDIGRVGKGVEEYVQKMQQYLCRNHSDERLKVEIAARHRIRLLTATQQSSVVGRELVQLEDMLEWAKTNIPDHELVTKGSEVKELANNIIKLSDGLYSPRVESEQFKAINSQIKEVLDKFMDGLFLEHIKARSEKMVNKSIDVCTTLLNEEAVEKLKDLIVQDKSSEFSQAKRDVLRHALPEIINHVSDTNVDVAATISEVVVEHTLQVLEKINHKLFKLQQETRAKSKDTPDTKVSRNFTFRVQEDTSKKKKKKRVRREDPEDNEDEAVDAVELPSVPLATEGPALQHLGKTRPKPARVQRTVRSSAKRSAPEEASDTATTTTTASDAAPEKTATPDPTPAKVAIKPPPVLEKKKKTEEPVKQEVVREEETPEDKVGLEDPADRQEDIKMSEESFTSEELEEHRTIAQDVSSPASPTVLTTDNEEESRDGPEEDNTDTPTASKPDAKCEETCSPDSRNTTNEVKEAPSETPEKVATEDKDSNPEVENQATRDNEDKPKPPAVEPEVKGKPKEDKLSTVEPVEEGKPKPLAGEPAEEKSKPSAVEPSGKDKLKPSAVEEDKPPTVEPALDDKPTAEDKPKPPAVEDKPKPLVVENKPKPPAVEDKPKLPTAEDIPAVEDKPSKADDKSSGSVKSKRAELAKMFEQANSPSTASKSASQSKDNIMADWEVIDGPKASADSVKKPPPPAVKEKPRNKPTAGDNDTESKGVSVLAAAQSSSLANVLQKGLQKPAKDTSDTAESPRQSPSPAPRAFSAEKRQSKIDEHPPTPAKKTPSPAPKPRPKPSVRSKRTDEAT